MKDTSYTRLIESGFPQNPTFIGLDLDFRNFLLQCLNCIMINFLSLQTEIFESFGYKKFVAQKNGTMDKLLYLSDLKAQSMAYCFNNQKIRKIIQIQRHKETVSEVVEQLKQKLKNWRNLMRKTLG